MPFFRLRWWWLWGICALFLGVVLARIRFQNTALPSPQSYVTDEAPQRHSVASVPSIFSNDFPESRRLKEELRYVRKIGKLREENERLITRVVTAASKLFKMPPSVLWCLLFQESRLDHLQGIADNSGARGLGQFSSFSFYEINHHLDRYYAGSLKTWIELLGRDVRPVAPKPESLSDPSSYFYIPTAVISSATFLNNRYHHLSRVLSRHRVTYDPQLLWLHAALAYNKGSRSVLALWKETRRHHRRLGERLFTEPQVFFSSVGTDQILSRALQRIWTPARAQAYAREASRHMKIITECSLADGGVR